ncbi:hypothetical protein BMS3Abin07_02042 [bacterium BMS3Abin07]|nr:hypothetical protein BMS3Abin07_02042 [bacterium BMS3Abin07]GBE32487.1 hypothetical protein BMS3Bbin05_01402 [bacterium BMS3Bbin05]
MNCPEFKKLIFEYMEKEMDNVTKKEFQLHLSTCKDCERDLMEIAKAVSLFRRLKKIAVPEALDSKIQNLFY